MNEFRWLDECSVPVQVYQYPASETPGEAGLSTGTPKPPDSDGFCKRNDSTPESAWAYMASQVDVGPNVSCGTVVSCDRKDDNLYDEPSLVQVESCPECGTVTDIEYEDAGPDTFSVPYAVQSWLFEALIESEIDHLHEIIDDHHDEIVKMARRRHREGFVTHGSGMYAWSPERRLDETLQELADAGVYPTSGPTE